ncbi:hypothetical protein WI26_07465 [Burkholderia diffusa]|nr:hypothetical protein WI26_07465 [Burkholderia diffusa]
MSQSCRLSLHVVYRGILHNGVYEFCLQSELRVELQRQRTDLIGKVCDRLPASFVHHVVYILPDLRDLKLLMMLYFIATMQANVDGYGKCYTTQRFEFGQELDEIAFRDCTQFDFTPCAVRESQF